MKKLAFLLVLALIMSMTSLSVMASDVDELAEADAQEEVLDDGVVADDDLVDGDLADGDLADDDLVEGDLVEDDLVGDEEPVAEEPVVEEPAVEEPAVVDQPVPEPVVVPITPEPITAPLPTQVNLVFTIGELTYTNNGVDAEAPAAPYIDEASARTMVPLAVIAEAFGATTNWIDETRTVNIVRGTVVLDMPVDEELPDGMGMPAIVDDRTFVPLGYIATQFGAEVDWDGDTREVSISLQ